MYKNMKIRGKLLLGFLILLALLIITALVSWMQMDKIAEQVTAYSERTLPNVTSVWEIRRCLVSEQRYILGGIAEDNMDNIKNFCDQAMADGDRIQEILPEYEKTARCDEQDLANFKKYIAETETYIDQIIPLVLQGTTESNAQAFQIYINEYKPAADNAAATADKIYQGQQERADEQAETAKKAETTAITVIVVLAVVSVVITMVVTVVTTSSLVTPIKEIEDVLQRMSAGDFTASVKYRSEDELGEMAAGMSKMEKTITSIITDIGQVFGKLGAGDFTAKSSNESMYVGGYAPILKDMNTLIKTLTNTLVQINQSADQVANGSEQVSIGAQSLSQGAVEQASSVEELSATINEISGKIQQTSKNAQTAKSLTDTCANSLEISKQKMTEMINAMNEITNSSNEINKIIKTIDDIAFQTNILSLNAAVEAARAGAAGKGFAVVADEVRNLASKSAEAVQSTTVMIESTINAVNNGTKIVDDTAKSIEDVYAASTQVASVVEGIAHDAGEQSDAIKQITVGVDQISSVVQTNSATSEESAAASEELSGQAEGLKTLISNFKLSH